MVCGTEKTYKWPVGQRWQMKWMACRKQKTNYTKWPIGKRRQWMARGTEKTNEMTGLWDREDRWMTCGTEKTSGWSLGQRRQMKWTAFGTEKTNEWPVGQRRQNEWHEYPKRHAHQQLVTARSLTSRQPHRISSGRASTVLYHTVKTIPAPRGRNSSPDHRQEI